MLNNQRTPVQEVRFCQSADGVRIAYAKHGSGPPLVLASCWLSHLSHDWQSPVWRHFLDDLASIATVIRYDERGFGLSDWDVHEDFSLEARVADLEAVIEDSGLRTGTPTRSDARGRMRGHLYIYTEERTQGGFLRLRLPVIGGFMWRFGIPMMMGRGFANLIRAAEQLAESVPTSPDTLTSARRSPRRARSTCRPGGFSGLPSSSPPERPDQSEGQTGPLA